MKKFSLLLFALIFILFSCRDLSQKSSLSLPVYTGDSLRHVAVPVGGIGTGNILLGGRGNILELEIFGKAELDELPPYMCFFAIHSRSKTSVDTRIAEGVLPDDFPNPFGVPREQLAGVPRFEKAEFRNEYPLSFINLYDNASPVKAELTSYNPFIPLDTDASSMPMAVFSWKLTNTTKDTVYTSLSLNMGNPFNSYSNDTELQGEVSYSETKNYQAILFDKHSPDKGQFMMLTTTKDINVSTRWYRGSWWDNAEIFWRDYSDDGYIEDFREKYNFQNRQHDVATLNVPVILPPSAEKVIPFYMFWSIPEREIENSMALGTDMDINQKITNFYSATYPDALSVAEDYFDNKDYLDSTTFLYHDLLFASTVPSYVIDAVASNSAAFRTNLLLRTEEGTVHAWEGLGDDFGCCPGNCTHVWNYAQSLAYLFPELEMNMRETNYLHDTHYNGYQSFRTAIPHGEYWFMNVAADGQMGTIMRVYREWKYSGNNEWLTKLWPSIKSALEFAWKGTGEIRQGFEWMKNTPLPWDPGKQGVIRTLQHNTYDIDFYGPNMLTGSLYLGALKACSEMAAEMNEPDKADEYYALFLKGREKYEELLWNGEYYEQIPEIAEGVNVSPRLLILDESGEKQLKYQYGKGCLSDQLLGQFLADVSGLGFIMDSTRTSLALKSVYEYNFVKSFSEVENVQRVYALNGEAGLKICSWPLGGKPAIPFVYSDEVWTGIEYQVAATLIYHGMTEQGLEIAEAVRNRYRGYNRNPLAEIESGKYYARALSSWALLPALSGYKYDGIKNSMSFSPAVNKDNFFVFWSTATAWGSFNITEKSIILKVEFGELVLKDFSFSHPQERIIIDTKPVYDALSYEENMFKLVFKDEIKLNKGEELKINTDY